MVWPFLPLLLMASGCASGLLGGQESLAERFGSCEGGLGEDRVAAEEFLPTVERWLLVERSYEPLGGGSGSENVQLRVRPISEGGLTGAATTEQVYAFRAMDPGIDWALRNGGKVYSAMMSEGLERESVGYVLVVTARGSHFFAGNCAYATLASRSTSISGVTMTRSWSASSAALIARR